MYGPANSLTRPLAPPPPVPVCRPRDEDLTLVKILILSGYPEGRMSRKSSVSKKEKEVAENCATCNICEGSSDDWLQCEVCDSWHHASCVDVSKATFDACKKIKKFTLDM